MHWQVAPTISAFLQREGRLDRPGSLTLRHRMHQYYKMNKKPDENESLDGLIPMWYILDGEGINAEITQILPVYEYNESLDRMITELSAAQMYSNPLMK